MVGRCRLYLQLISFDLKPRYTSSSVVSCFNCIDDFRVAPHSNCNHIEFEECNRLLMVYFSQKCLIPSSVCSDVFHVPVSIFKAKSLQLFPTTLAVPEQLGLLTAIRTPFMLRVNGGVFQLALTWEAPYHTFARMKSPRFNWRGLVDSYQEFSWGKFSNEVSRWLCSVAAEVGSVNLWDPLMLPQRIDLILVCVWLLNLAALFIMVHQQGASWERNRWCC